MRAGSPDHTVFCLLNPFQISESFQESSLVFFFSFLYISNTTTTFTTATASNNNNYNNNASGQRSCRCGSNEESQHMG